jgi:hypothetical protein
MPDLGLDALVKASRTVNAPTENAREHNRRRVATRIATGIAAGAALSVAREGVAIGGGTVSGTSLGASAALSGGFAKWAVVSSILLAVGGATGVAVHVARGRASAKPTLDASPETTAQATLASKPITPSPQTGVHLDLPNGSDVPEAPSPAIPPLGQVLPATDPLSVPRAHQDTSARRGSSAQEARNFERELQLLRSARRAVDSGSPALSLSLLDRYAAEFPQGALKPEFQTTRILALCAAGRIASAQQARDEFIKQQPGSPLAEGLRATCAGGH